MRIACWIPKATKTHSEYVVLTPFSGQLLQQRTKMYRTLVVLLMSGMGSFSLYSCSKGAPNF